MRTKFLVFCGVVGLLFVATTASMAQPPAGGRQGGMFGGGGAQGSPLMIIRQEAVQKELSLKDDQISKLKTLGEEVQKEMQAGGGREAFQALQNLPQEERRAKMTEITAKATENAKKVQEKFLPKVAEILDADQMKRVKEISLQASGSAALQDAEVVKALNITSEQTEKLKAQATEFAAKQREMFTGGGGGDRDEMRKKMQTLNEERTKQAVSVLSSEQQEQFGKMKGKAFDVSQLRATGGGRRQNNK